MMQAIAIVVLSPRKIPPLVCEEAHEEFWEEDWQEHLRAICPQCGQPAFSYLTRRWGRVNGVVIYEEVTGSCSVCNYEISETSEITPS
jgi:hypothetical protein